MWSCILKMLLNIITAFSFILNKFMNSLELKGNGFHVIFLFLFFFFKKMPLICITKIAQTEKQR